MNAYGKFTYTDKIRDDGKVKGTGVTIRERVTPVLWEMHIEGKQQLGIIPIDEESMTKFGAIDIDDYNLNQKAINEKICKNGLPVIPFRSKSGGCHLFLFCSDRVDAGVMQAKLRQIAAFLGHGQAEIFPKQTQILRERGDVGQWINMPYFEALKTMRYAIRPEDNARMGIDEFIEYVPDKVITRSDLEDLKVPVNTDELYQAPPCLQHLTTQGFPEGTRNNGLFALGIYARKLDPDNWKGLVEGYNVKYMKPPLSPNEVLVVIKSLNRESTDYNYPCKKMPICNHCNAPVCRTRKFGVGDTSGLPAMGTLTKLDSDPPIWFIDIDGGGRMELTTEELQNPIKFQNKCLSSINVMPVMPNRQNWQTIVANLLNNLTIIPVPQEVTPKGQLIIHLEEFCLNRNGGEDPMCLHRGLVWDNEDLHHFRLNDFVQYLERKKFYDFGTHQIVAILRANKGQYKKLHTSMGKYVSVITVPIFRIDNMKFTPPEVKKPDVPF